MSLTAGRLTVPRSFLVLHLPAMLLAVGILMLCVPMGKRTFYRRQGIVLLGVHAAYMIVLARYFM